MRDATPRPTLGLCATLGLTVLGLGSCEAVDYAEVFETEAPIDRVVILGDVGDLEIVGADRETVQVSRTVDGWKGGIALSSAVVDGTLTLEARCTGWLGCRVDSQLLIPADAELQVSAGEGELSLVGLTGALDLALGTGSITGTALGAERVSATVTSGDLSLQFEAPPARIDATMASGDVSLALPVDAVDAALDLAGGRARVEGLELSPDAESRVDILSAGGDVTLSR